MKVALTPRPVFVILFNYKNEKKSYNPKSLTNIVVKILISVSKIMDYVKKRVHHTK